MGGGLVGCRAKDNFFQPDSTKMPEMAIDLTGPFASFCAPLTEI
jgi:hypothetical protein